MLKLFRVWCPEFDGCNAGDAERLRAIDEEDAAERYAEDTDCSGTPIFINGRGFNVLVAPDDDPSQKPKEFEVHGEYVPTYSASEVK